MARAGRDNWLCRGWAVTEPGEGRVAALADAISRFLAANRGRYRYLLLANDVASVHCPPGSPNGAIPMGAWRTLDPPEDVGRPTRAAVAGGGGVGPLLGVDLGH